MRDVSTVEPQYQSHVELKKTRGLTRLGVEKNGNWYSDPRRLLFALSRYKFVAKMLSGRSRVVEIGCGDAFAAPIILQEINALHAIDIDPVFIEDIRERADSKWPFTFAVHDILTGPVPGEPFNAAFTLDVLEHIPADKESLFMRNIVDSLVPTGELVVGTPSLESQAYASEGSRIGHVNCKTAAGLKELMHSYFHSVFMLSMNDEVVHTGYAALSHYLFAIGAHKR